MRAVLLRVCAVMLAARLAVVATVGTVPGVAAAVAVAAIATVPVVAAAAEPQLATERIVLHTTLGDLVLALYPDVAPRHVEQILRLVRLGVYDTTYFYRVDPSFVAQLATAHARGQRLTPEQAAAIKPIRAELSELRHVRGTLSMAHEDGKPDSAETSFSILYGPAAHLDRQYTVFGHVEAGDEVLDAMAAAPRDAQNRPITPIEITRAEVVDARDVQAVARTAPLAERGITRGSGSPATGGAQNAAASGRPATPFLALVAVMMVFGLATFLLAGRAPVRLVGSLGLLTTLVGAFLLYTALVPVSATSPWLAVGLFVSSIAVFKLMSWFESEPPAKPQARPDARAVDRRRD